MNIDKRFYIELFENKHVKLNEKKYKELYKQIWLCEQYFKEFLLVPDSSLKICFAKKIYTYIQTFNDFIIPNNFTNQIIYHQQHDLVDDNESYIPQDHIIHSINLYILGVYLFFNFPAFHKKLLGTPSIEKNLNYRILSFVKRWRSFSLYHDIGYSLENITNKNGKLKNQSFIEEISTTSVCDNMVYLYTIRNFSRLIVDISLIERKGIQINIKNYIDSCCEWIKNDTTNISYDDMIRELSIVTNPLLLSDISSDYGLKNLLPFIGDSEYLVIINDELECPIGFIIKKGKNICDYFFKKHYHLNKLQSHNKKYTYQYIISNKATDYLNIFDDYNPTHIKGFYKSLPQKFQNYFELASEDQHINDLIFEIFNWFVLKTNNSMSTNFEDKYKESLLKCYKEAIKSCILKNIDINKLDENFSKEYLLNFLINTFNDLKNPNLIKKIITEIYNKANKDYMENNGVYYDYIDHCSTMQQTLLNLINKKDLQNINFFEIHKNTIQLKPFSHDVEKLFENELYAKISERCELLGVDIKKLCLYRTKHSSCDHGLVSASFLYQAIVFSSYLAELCESHPSFLLTWDVKDVNSLFNDIATDEYADIIFAVLLHNIYTKESDNKFGIEYTQKIEVNAFSYFCTFCDVLQKWKRPKQLDFSKTNLPEHHYMNDDFDLVVTSNNIMIVCNNFDVDTIKKDIQNAETFLSGISNIIQIKSQ